MIQVEQYLNFPIKTVWKAITDPKQMRLWYFKNMPDFKAELDFETSFVMDSGKNLFSAQWRVTKVIIEKEIQYKWTYKEYEGEAFISFILEKQNGGTLIRIIDIGLESFPQDMEEFQVSSCKAGWEFFIQQELPKFLKSK